MAVLLVNTRRKSDAQCEKSHQEGKIQEQNLAWLSQEGFALLLLLCAAVLFLLSSCTEEEIKVATSMPLQSALCWSSVIMMWLCTVAPLC